MTKSPSGPAAAGSDAGPPGERRILIDYENVPANDLGKIGPGFRVVVFVGSSQKSVPFELVEAAQSLGDRLQWLKVDGTGRNALDFHIAYHLGCCYTATPDTECYIVSKDSGYDPLVRHLNAQGRRCRRINSLLELAPRSGDSNGPHYRRVLDNLGKMPKQVRPRRRSTLAQHIATVLSRTVSPPEIERLVDLLFAENKVRELDGALSYTF